MAMIEGPTKAARCYEAWKRRKDDADYVRQFFEDDWREGLEFYFNLPYMDMPPGAEWMRAELLPEHFTGTESLTARTALQLLANPRLFTVEAPQLQGTRVQRQVEQLIRQQFKRAGFSPKAAEIIRMGYIQGHIVMKNYWLRQRGSKWVPIFANPRVNAEGEQISGGIIDHERVNTTLHNGPWFDFPDLFKVWKSPAVDFRGQPLWWMESISYDLDMLREQQRWFKDMHNEPLYDDAVLDNMVSSTSYQYRSRHGTAATVRHDSWDRSSAATTTGIDDTLLHGSNSVELMQCWGYVPREAEGGYDYPDEEGQERMQLFTPDGELLRDEPMKWSPYRDVYMMRVGKEPYGRTPMKWALTEIEQMSEVRNLRLADAWTNIIGGFVADSSVDWGQSDFLKAPGAIWFYDGAGTRKPQEVLYPIPRQPSLPDAYLEVNDMFSRLQRVTGADQNALGQSYGARTAATEVIQIDQKSGSRLRLQTSLLTWQMVRQAAEDCYKLDQMFLSEGEDVQLPGEPETLRRIFAENLDFDVDISVDAGEFGSMNAMTLEAITQGLGMFMNDPEMREHIDKREVIEEFFYRLGSPATLKILRREEDVQADQQARQEMEMAMAALGGQGRVPGGR